MTDLAKKYIFRMTHIHNIPHILQYGITHISSSNRNVNYEPIGDLQVINRRNNFQLPNASFLGDYIPFYFGIRTPMLYVIQKGLNGVNPVNPTNIIYLASSVQRIIDLNLGFVFSDGHSLDNFTQFYDYYNLNEIYNLVNKKDTHATYWKDDNDLDLKRRKEAEFLVESDIDVSGILAYIVFDNIAQNALMNFGVNPEDIYIEPNKFYFYQ